jgi:hypothetical protein
MTDPDFVDRRYDVPAVADLVARPGVVGVARHIEFPSFEPERLFTLVYRPDAVEVSAVVGASSLWCSMPVVCQVVSTGTFEVEDGEQFDPGSAWRRSAVLSLPSGKCPPLLRSWESVRAAATEARNCSTNTCDGIVYRHRVADRSFHSVADWYNPDPREHAPQLAFIKAYVALLRRLSLYPV